MKNYIMHKLDDNKYIYFLVCLTYESILNYLNSIENDIKNSCLNGEILIDQLLVTGNGKNRFLKCEYTNGKINLSTAQNVNPENEYKFLSTKLLQQNFENIKISILTEKQKKLIIEGNII